MTWKTGPKNGTGIPGSSSAPATNYLGDLRQVTRLLCSHPPLLTFLVCKVFGAGTVTYVVIAQHQTQQDSGAQLSHVFTNISK